MECALTYLLYCSYQSKDIVAINILLTWFSSIENDLADLKNLEL